MIKRLRTREIKIGDRIIGGGNPILVQSMTNTDTKDIQKTLRQIRDLIDEDCEIVRIAVPDEASCKNIGVLKENVEIPIVADIHFDYTLALCAIKQGADKIRINPGNIGKKEYVRKICDRAKERGIPIRIGINSGSLEKDLLEKHGGPYPEALVESALRNVEMFESFGFHEIVLSIKSASVLDTIEANRTLSQEIDYPIHLGITEAGIGLRGAIKSAVGLAPLLHMGIGDTVRVSLTGDPVEEVKIGYQILRSLNLREQGVVIISCPTCGRMEIDLVPIVKVVEERVSKVKQNIKIAIMGCSVNGPGEAKMADIGIAGGKGSGVIFQKGVIIDNVPESKLIDSFLSHLDKFLKKKREGRLDSE
jgi:(E)-4-hydroxy-3-methylbut-2-enyl-diphosphate synthase